MTDHSAPPWASGTGTAHGATVTGITGHLAQVRAQITNGPDTFTITGLPGALTATTRDRIRAAIVNSGLPWPSRSITVTIDPPGLPGCGLDLPLAIAILAAVGNIDAAATRRCVMLAELGLDGRLRPVSGVLPALTAAGQAGYQTAVLAPANAEEAGLAPGIAVVPCTSLRTVLSWLRAWRLPPSPPWYLTGQSAPMPPGTAVLAASPRVLLAVQAAAAGGHHLSLTGLPSRVIEVAACIQLLLPDLDPGETAEVAAVYSVAGCLSPGPQITRPPWRNPHHTTSLTAMLGGGAGITRPGEVALAHRGALFLDRAPEFSRQVLTALRQPLTSGEVTISRGGQITRFPARTTLIAGLPPCPCGDPTICACRPVQIRRYHQRVTEALAGYLTLHVKVGEQDSGGDPDPRLWAVHVADARERARHRLHGTPWNRNAEVPGSELARSWRPDSEAHAAITRAIDLGRLGRQSSWQVIRLAWTLADLAGAACPSRHHCEQATALYLGTSDSQAHPSNSGSQAAISCRLPSSRAG